MAHVVLPTSLGEKPLGSLPPGNYFLDNRSVWQSPAESQAISGKRKFHCWKRFERQAPLMGQLRSRQKG